MKLNYILRKPTGVRYYNVSIVYFFWKWGGVSAQKKVTIKAIND